MLQLDEAQFHTVRRLSDPLPHHLSMQSVVEGAGPGRVWADCPDSPAAALIDAPEGLYLIGSPHNERFGNDVAAFLGDDLLPGGQAGGWGYACLHYSPPEWRPVIERAVEPFSPEWHYQHYLKLETLHLNWRDMLPPQFEMVCIDADFLGSRIPGAEHFGGGGFWSFDDFLERGFGFSVVHGGEIVTWVFADCVVGNRTEIGIHTREDFRRRGLGSATVAATVEHCLERGLTEIGWHCWSRNTASLKTAEKAGFARLGEHPGLEIHYPQ